MAEILLTSEAFVKTVSNISDNVAGGYLLPSIREAQEIYLQQIIGTNLLNSLKVKVASGNVPQEYRDLINVCQYYLAYQTIVMLLPKVSCKITNAGVVRTNDENVQNISEDDLQARIADYQHKADFYCRRVQMFICEHRANYPELDEATAHRIRQQLASAATCGLWLGGARGKIVR